MKNDGFTYVELLFLSIIILGFIALAMPAFRFSLPRRQDPIFYRHHRVNYNESDYANGYTLPKSVFSQVVYDVVTGVIHVLGGLKLGDGVAELVNDRFTIDTNEISKLQGLRRGAKAAINEYSIIIPNSKKS